MECAGASPAGGFPRSKQGLSRKQAYTATWDRHPFQLHIKGQSRFVKL
jgi:hypothetical protein